MAASQPLRSAVAFLALAAHNAEEAVFARHWALANRELLLQFTRRDLAEIWAGPRFRSLLAGLTLVLLVLSAFAARAPKGGIAVYLLLGVLAAFVANALVPHIVGALVFSAYVPGLLTAIIVVPFVAAWVYASTVRDGYATTPGAVVATGAGIALYAILVGLAALSGYHR